MSLFGNPDYHYRETYFVLFEAKNRPNHKQVERALRELNARYDVAELESDESGGLESVTVFSPDDYAAMDIVYASGEEVQEHVREEVLDELRAPGLTPTEQSKLHYLMQCDARYDVYHFEQIVGGAEDDENEEFLDPGSLLIVLERLAKLCKGVGVDPQSGVMI